MALYGSWLQPVFAMGRSTYAALTVTCAVLIAVCRYLEGLFSHLGAYGILAKMRVHLFDAIDRISPAYMIGRETGDIMNIAVADIETLEYFFAHTIGPMFTVILLPVTTSGSGMVCKSAVCTGADPNLYYDQRCTASWGTDRRTGHRYALQGRA